MNIVKIIIFDLLGVVIPNKTGGSENNIRQLYNMTSQIIPFKEFYTRYKSYIIGNINKDEFWKGFDDNAKNIEKEYLDTYKIYPNFDAIVKPLRTNYQIFALSNHPTPWIEYINKKFLLGKYFEEIFVSGTLQLKKPNPEIYKIILRKYSQTAKNTIIIDDQKKNLSTAKDLGITTIHFYTTQDNTDFTPDYSIQDLHELNKIL